MNRMISAMGLAGFEADYFKALVNFCNAKDDDAKMPFWKEMRKIALEYKVRVVDKEAVEYFDGWKNSVVRELAPMMPGVTPGKTKAGFLKRDSSGAYRQTEKNVVASQEGMVYAVHALQKKMVALGGESIERFDAKTRSVSSVTLTVNRNAYERIAREIDDFRKRIVAIATDTEDADQIYQMNLQFFPMTWNIKEFKED